MGWWGYAKRHEFLERLLRKVTGLKCVDSLRCEDTQRRLRGGAEHRLLLLHPASSVISYLLLAGAGGHRAGDGGHGRRGGPGDTE
eukprot:3230374-Pyramimonas_sp.AAC.1